MQKIRAESIALRPSHSQPTGSNHPYRKTSHRRQNAGPGRDRASNCPWRPEAPAALPIDDAVLTQLEAASAFAPLHMPSALAVIRFARAFSRVAAGGVFRHHLSRRIAGGRARASNCQGITVGRNSALRVSRPFMQINRASAWNDLPDRLVIAHLGNGASVTAVKGGSRSTPAWD